MSGFSIVFGCLPEAMVTSSSLLPGSSCSGSNPTREQSPKETPTKLRNSSAYINITGWWLEPLWKIWVRLLGWWHSQPNGKIKNVPNHQPVYNYICLCLCSLVASPRYLTFPQIQNKTETIRGTNHPQNGCFMILATKLPRINFRS